MLNDVNLNEKLNLAEEERIKEEIATYGNKLFVLQQKIKKNKIPVMLVFEGWGTSGKGSAIAKILKYVDPRGVHMHSIVRPSEEEKRKTYMNRFWLNIPAKGEIAIFDRSWYHDWMSKEDVTHIDEIKNFERKLTDDGYVIFKFFLHITKKEQLSRIKELQFSKATKWRVSKADLKQNEKYEKYEEYFDEVLEKSNYQFAKWNVISGMDKDILIHTVLKTVVEKLEKLVKKAEKEGTLALQKKGILPANMKFELQETQKLSEINLDCRLSEKEYRKKLDKFQNKLFKLSYKLYKKQIPMVICYEGWDAAGKGGNIKRMVSSFDPRDYVVNPVAAPDATEKARHYLWRFYRNMPKTGHIAVFDRTWYGRVMVERLEGFSSEIEWKRSYNEINEFEKELTDSGAIVVKFWLQIDKDEQLRRFTERQNTPEKQWKITDEDWRNREKWDLYEVAVDEMIQYTSTKNAPWHIIESNDKYYARIKAMEIVIDAIEEKLNDYR